MKKMHLGIIIAILLIVYWYMKDHPQTQPEPATRQGMMQSPIVEMAA